MTLVFVVAEGTVPRTAVSSRWNVIIAVQLGHLSRVCRSKKPGRSVGKDTAQRRPKDTYTLFTVAGDRSRAPLTQKVKLDGADLMME